MSSSNSNPAAVLAAIQCELEAHLGDRQPRTRKEYFSHLRQFEAWRNGQSATPQLLEEYQGTLAQGGRSPSFIKTHLAAVRWWVRRLADLPQDPATLPLPDITPSPSTILPPGETGYNLEALDRLIVAVLAQAVRDARSQERGRQGEYRRWQGREWLLDEGLRWAAACGFAGNPARFLAWLAEDCPWVELDFPAGQPTELVKKKAYTRKAGQEQPLHARHAYGSLSTSEQHLRQVAKTILQSLDQVEAEDLQDALVLQAGGDELSIRQQTLVRRYHRQVLATARAQPSPSQP